MEPTHTLKRFASGVGDSQQGTSSSSKRVRWESSVQDPPPTPRFILVNAQKSTQDGAQVDSREYRDPTTGAVRFVTERRFRGDPEEGRALQENPGKVMYDYKLIRVENTAPGWKTAHFVSTTDPSLRRTITEYAFVPPPVELVGAYRAPAPAPAPVGAGGGGGPAQLAPAPVGAGGGGGGGGPARGFCPVVEKIPSGYRIRILYETLEGEPVYHYHTLSEMEFVGGKLFPRDFVILGDALCDFMGVPPRSIMHPRSVYAFIMVYVTRKKMLAQDPKSAVQKKTIITIPRDERAFKALMGGESRLDITFETDFIRKFILPLVTPITRA